MYESVSILKRGTNYYKEKGKKIVQAGEIKKNNGFNKTALNISLNVYLLHGKEQPVQNYIHFHLPGDKKDSSFPNCLAILDINMK